MKGQTDTTVAIVAIIATALAGVVGPAITGAFSLWRLRREQGEARRMDKLAERRRLIYEALDQITAFEWKLIDKSQSQGSTPDFDFAATVLGHNMRLRALFGRTSDVATAYEACFAALGEVLAVKNDPDAAKFNAVAEASRLERERLVAVVSPFLERAD